MGDRSGLAGLPRTRREGPRRLRLGGRLRGDNLIARPAVEEAVLRGLGASARHNGDTLLGLLTDAQLVDADRHRRWSSALVKLALGEAGNKAALDGWVAKWAPVGDAAIDAYCAHLPDAPGAADKAKEACLALRKGMGL